MGVNRVDYGDDTLIDLTSDTVNADELAIGLTAHAANGDVVTGLAPKTWTGTHAQYEIEKDSIPVGTLVNFTDDFVNPGGGLVFDESEHKIGTFNGKNIYSKTIEITTKLAFPSNTWITIAPKNDADILIYCGVNQKGAVGGTLYPLIGATVNDSFQVMHTRNVTTELPIGSVLIIIYTKVGD